MRRLWFFVLLAPRLALASVPESPIAPHADADDEREFQNVYQAITNPTIQTATISTETVNSSTIKALNVTSPLGLVGVINGSNATAGNVGEYLSSSYSGNFPATTVWGDATTLSLTAGDWDVAYFINGPTNLVTGIFYIQGFIGTVSGNTSAGISALNQAVYALSAATTIGAEVSMAIPRVRFSLATTTTIYAKYIASFTGTTPSCNVAITARRVR